MYTNNRKFKGLLWLFEMLYTHSYLDFKVVFLGARVSLYILNYQNTIFQYLFMGQGLEDIAERLNLKGSKQEN